jgi:hypothetical protein
MYLLNVQFYQVDQGDLARLGYLYYNPLPKMNVSNKFSLNRNYTLISELNLNKTAKYNVLTIGDSFSEQDSLGYQNYLANLGIPVLHVNRFLSKENQIQKLVELINGDFFDSIQVDYVVLQSIERNFVQRCQKIDYAESTQFKSVKNEVSKYKKKTPKLYADFFSEATIKASITNLQLLLSNKKPIFSQTYKVPTNSDNLFSENPKDLLFFQDDITFMSLKNDSSKVRHSNDVINTINNLLLEKGIVLIVLVCPDKYDLYYPYIQNNENFEKPQFFKFYNALNKDYIYVNAFETLSRQLEKQDNIYYYDDTHWSPISAEIIGREINEVVTEE